MSARKRAALATGVLTLMASGIFAQLAPSGTTAPEQKKTSAAAPSKSRAVIRTGWDYQGIDDPAVFKKDIEQLSKSRTLFVMFELPTCPHCGKLTSVLHDIQDNKKTPLDFDVLRVDVTRYPRIVNDLMQGRSVPENHVYYGGAQPFVFVGERDEAAMLDFMQQVHDWRAKNPAPAAKPPAPQSPAP